MDRKSFNALALAGGASLIGSKLAYGTSNSSLVPLMKNIILINVNLGFLPQNFNPDGDHLNSRYLEKFSPVHKKMTIFPGIEQAERLAGHRNHHSVFTGQSKYGTITGPFVSLDQLIANRTIQETKHKSIYASIEKGEMCFNMNGVSIPPISGPDKLYESLFGETKSFEEFEKKELALKVFKDKLTHEKDNPFFKAVINEKIEIARNDIKWAKVKSPKVDYKFEKHKTSFMNLPTNLELIKLGLMKNQFKILSFNIGTNGMLPLEGLTIGYHANSHHANEKKKLTELGIIEDYVSDHLAKFVIDLEKEKLLDDTIVLIAGNMGNPSLHSMKDMSVILAGGGFKHQKIVHAKDKGVLVHPLTNLYVSLLHQVGLTEVSHFAASSGNMDEVLI